MSAAPQASIVVPTRGGRERLPILLRALQAQTVPPEVVVVVDGDIDGTAASLAEWADRLDLHVVVLPENRGRSAALNAGFARARGRVLIRQDDDLEPAADFVERQLAHHAGDPVGVIGMCPEVFPEGAYARVYGQPADERIRSSTYALPPEQRWRMWSANVSVTRETFERVGGYDEDFRRYGWEDIDFGYRLHRLGVAIIVPRDIEARHHNPALTVRDRATRAYSSGDSRRFFESKHEVSQPRPRARGAWGRAVSTLAATMRSEATVGRLAAGVDTLLPVLPRPVAEKAVALVVEAAGAAALR